MPSFGVYVRDGDPLWKEIQKRADAHHQGNKSEYARTAMERDVAAKVVTDATSTTILVDLAKAFLAPIYTEDMAAACDGLNQKRELHDLLMRYIAERSEKPKSRSRIPS